MLNWEVIFLEFVTGTSDFGGKSLKCFQKKQKTQPDILEIYGRSRRATQQFFFWPYIVLGILY